MRSRRSVSASETSAVVYAEHQRIVEHDNETEGRGYGEGGREEEVEVEVRGQVV